MSTNRTVTAQTDIPQFQNVADTTYFSHTHIESINTIVSYDSSSSFNNYCTDPAEFDQNKNDVLKEWLKLEENCMITLVQ